MSRTGRSGLYYAMWRQQTGEREAAPACPQAASAEREDAGAAIGVADFLRPLWSAGCSAGSVGRGSPQQAAVVASKRRSVFTSFMIESFLVQGCRT